MNAPSPKIAIIILNWNGRADTISCLDSLQHIDYPNYTIILVDNGSTDGSISALRRKFPEVTFIENGENLGFAEGNNRGITYALKAGFDFIFLLNNDTVVDSQILKAFIETSQEGLKILGPKLYLYSDPTRFDHLGGKWSSELGEFELIGARQIDDGTQYESFLPMDYVCGAALFAPRQIYETIGLLEPKFFLFWEESDWCFRAKKFGFEIGLCPQAKVWHKVSASFSGRPHTTYFWWRNRLLWIERNLKKREKQHLYRRIIIPQAFKLSKLYAIKSCQYYLLKLLQIKKNADRHYETLQSYRAALCGMRHYLFKRFGNAPSWLFEKRGPASKY